MLASLFKSYRHWCFIVGFQKFFKHFFTKYLLATVSVVMSNDKFKQRMKIMINAFSLRFC